LTKGDPWPRQGIIANEVVVGNWLLIHQSKDLLIAADADGRRLEKAVYLIKEQ